MDSIGFNVFPSIFTILWLLFILGGVAGLIVFVIPIRGTMFAHEEPASKLKTIAERSGQICASAIKLTCW